MRIIFKYLTAVTLLLALLLTASCGGSSSAGSNSSNANSANSAAKTATNGNTGETSSSNSAETENRDLSPVTATALEIFGAAGLKLRTDSDYADFLKQYKDRRMTISEIYLWDVSSSELTVTDKKEAGGNFIKCQGSFSDYVGETAAKVKAIREKGNPMKVTVSGVVKNVKSFSSYDQSELTLNPCVLSEIAK